MESANSREKILEDRLLQLEEEEKRKEIKIKEFNEILFNDIKQYVNAEEYVLIIGEINCNVGSTNKIEATDFIIKKFIEVIDINKERNNEKNLDLLEKIKHSEKINVSKTDRGPTKEKRN